MRGKPAATFSDSVAAGITPADAGKTFGNPTHPKPHKDHPRGCGENFYRCFFFYIIPGSPPRMRGKQNKYFVGNAVFRITPADAGKTRQHCAPDRRHGDHPRGCGENRR